MSIYSVNLTVEIEHKTEEGEIHTKNLVVADGDFDAENEPVTRIELEGIRCWVKTKDLIDAINIIKNYAEAEKEKS